MTRIAIHRPGKDVVVDAARALIEALGGVDNIIDVEPCSLRIRVEVADQHPVREHDLRIPEVLAVVRSGMVVQIVAGLQSDEIAYAMKELITPGESDPQH